MSKTKIIFLCLTIAVISGFTGAFLSKNIYLGVLEEKTQENHLQNLAFTQLLLEHIDSGQFEQVHSEILRQFNSLVYSAMPTKAFSAKYREACLVHQAIYKYRLANPEKYTSTSSLDEEIKAILKFWSESDCNQESN